jgi:galactose mutarotase-like enzyme
MIMRKLSTSLLLLVLSSCTMLNAQAASGQQPSAKAKDKVTIGGEPVLTLHAPQLGKPDQPSFTSAVLLPGRGMSILQLKANIPSKGEVDVLTAPSVDEAKELLDNKDDAYGNKLFSVGGAFLVPYANRIRGQASADGTTLATTIAGKPITLPANWPGKSAGAEKVAMHGMMLKSQFQSVSQRMAGGASTASAVFHAGNFDGHWPSKTDITTQVSLRSGALGLTITAKNVGNEPLPIGIGWHPYFAIPSGDRKQAKLHLPADKRAVMNNYDDVFPTGQVVSVKDDNGKYDFTSPGGKTLNDMFLDDNFQDLQRAGGNAVSEIIDPASNYGIRIVSESPEIKSIQVYSPPDKTFVALEPQFNLPDPYGSEWKGANTGMVVLQPGQSVSWRVKLQLFTPNTSK